MTDNHLSELRFDALELHDSVRAGIRDAGFEFCTPIQANTLPIALQAQDVAGQAARTEAGDLGMQLHALQRIARAELAGGAVEARRLRTADVLVGRLAHLEVVAAHPAGGDQGEPRLARPIRRQLVTPPSR